jgi:hypothetical protein
MGLRPVRQYFASRRTGSEAHATACKGTARWWVARSMRSIGRIDDGELVGVGGLVNDWPTASPHPTISRPVLRPIPITGRLAPFRF